MILLFLVSRVKSAEYYVFQYYGSSRADSDDMFMENGDQLCVLSSIVILTFIHSNLDGR
jgi:hypothetical protein